MRALEQKMDELCHIGYLAYAKGMVVGSGGNISFRQGEGMYITPHGCTLDQVTPEDLIYMDFAGHCQAEAAPSVEWQLHLACYKKRPDVTAIIHLHSYYSIVAGIAAREGGPVMPAYTGGYAYKVGKVGIVPLYRSGEEGLCQAVAKELEDCACVLMRNHGIIACAGSLRAAFSLCEDVEMNARLHAALKGEGALTPAQIARLK